MARVKYEMNLKFTVVHTVDDINSCDLKTDREYAFDVCRLVADEMCNTCDYVSFEIVESKIDATA